MTIKYPNTETGGHKAAEVSQPWDARQERHLPGLGPLPAVWQTIETAPLGGKWVLLWWPSVTDVPFVGFRVNGVWHAATRGDTWDNDPGPTHWMLLPEGPTS